MKKQGMFRLLAGTAAVLAAAPVAAQTAPSATEVSPAVQDEIVVTAQRRQERVVDVPISITVASAAQLERQQVNTVNDLARISPSLEIQQAPGQNTGGGGSLRGIGTQTFSAGSVASVGIVVDQVSQGNANISDLFDVARIEVLKGPQGTLFGLTTSAGVINITTNAPDPTQFSARLRTELSNEGTLGSGFGNQVVQGMVNVPLSADAALRVSGFGNLRQGPNRNATTGDLNDTNRWGGRARLLWRNDKLTLNLIGDYSKTTTENGGDFFTFVRAGGPGPFFGGAGFDPLGITARLASCGVTPGEGNRNYCIANGFRGRAESYGVSLQAEYAFEPFTLTSITAYRGSTEKGGGAATNVFRGDPLELQVANGLVDRRVSLFTQELRLSSPSSNTIEYTAGLFYSRQVQDRDPESLRVTLRPAPGVVIPIATQLGATDHIYDESYAAFGQATIHVTKALRLIAGGRYTNARLGLDRVSLDSPANPNYAQRQENNVFSYRVGAQYDLNPTTMVYATASRGFKGGQIATPALPLTPYVVRPEIPRAYELGLKSTLFGGWVLDLNAFYQNIKDFQAQSCTTIQNTGAISCVQQNINGVKSRGAEINLFGRVTEGLSVNTGFLWAKATYPSNFLGTDGTQIGGTQLAYAPEYKFTFSGEYEAPLSDSINGFIAADTVWKSRIRYEANSRIETTYRPHWLVGGRIGARFDHDRFQVALFARNLFNQHEPLLYQSDFPYNGTQNVGAIYGPQSFRQIGLSLDAKF
ncbi:TonB-dependent receptor [Sphingomonas elodea]|uniref:TonB-dependent receptor n=1 Tax=Sphingomonas elodea TaxID=179878 RepID=UPI00026301BC|nr:TonB-dependent receptor [Sphingomonas elodea]